MEQRISLVTLGVRDLDRAKAFYAALGWHPVGGAPEDIAFYQVGGMVLALWDRAQLADDGTVSLPST